MPDMLHLLPQHLLVRTGEFDHADWNYRPVLGRIQRLRFRVVVRLLAGRRYTRLCEVGYGSGVFLPTLARLCDELYAVDLHDRTDAVGRALANVGVTATLASGSVTALPFDDGRFDAVVMISALEYVEDIDRACTELVRVMAPGARLVVVFPGDSPLLDWGVRAWTGENPERNYGARRGRIEAATRRHFRTEEIVSVPALGGRLVRLYTGMRLAAP
jgi:SAM-dependent methyltransferase